jgi:hypothetical protein
VSGVRKAEEAVLSAAFGLERGGKRSAGSHVSITVESWDHLQHTIAKLRAAAADVDDEGADAALVAAGLNDEPDDDREPSPVIGPGGAT